jgi:hypothetical protein
MDNQFYTLERWSKDLGQRMISLVTMYRANEESETKSARLKDAWSARREAARAGKGKASNACPMWLRAVDGKFEIIPERVEVIQRIIAERHLGLGKQAIAARLNADKVPAFRGQNGWHGSAIERLVKNEALLGTYQPRHTDDTPDEEPIRGYYPAVISKSGFWRAQWNGERASRGQRRDRVNNLLSEMVTCEACGAKLVFEDKGRKAGSNLICGKLAGVCAPISIATTTRRLKGNC